MNPKITHWDSAWGPLREETMRLRLTGEGYAVAKYHYPPGTCFPSHTHTVNKKDTVLQGHLRIRWEGGETVLDPGDMIEIPAGFPHSTEVVGSETVVSLDATKPA